ncbi:MAG TPA: hypothetical protein VFM18_15610, partial [Methanosarcina sp.]|nr:hypothetical protein [Methanosarcina sp.]
DIAVLRADLMMREVLSREDNYLAFLTGDNNFRYKINPNYKANRKDKPRPRHLTACKDFLVSEYKAIVCDGYEADDALGFNQTNETTIYSIDKDLMMIPGCHFNFVNGEYTEVSELDGLKAFYRQMLIGDTSDNIHGVAKIGKVKAAKHIDHLESEKEMAHVVMDLYNDVERFIMNANCLWIMRKEGETYSKRPEVSQQV